MITKLTNKQRLKLKEYVEKYITIGISTERINPLEAKAIINNFYKHILKREKPKIKIFANPVKAYLFCWYYKFYKKLFLLKLKKAKYNLNEVYNKVNNEVRNEVEHEVKNEVRNEVEHEVNNEVRNEVEHEVNNEVRNEVYNEIRNEVSDEIYSEVENEIKSELWAHVGYEVYKEVKNEIWNEVENEIKNKVWNEVEHEIKNELWAEVGNEVYKEVKNEIWAEVGNEVNSKVRSEIWNEVEIEVWNEVNSEVRNEVKSTVWNEVNSEIKNEVKNEIYNEVENEVNSEIKNEVRNEVKNEIKNEVENEVKNEVWNEVEREVSNEVGNEVRNEVYSEVYNKVRNEVRNEVYSEVRSEVEVWNEIRNEVKKHDIFYFSYLYGNLEASYFAYYSFINEVLGVQFKKQKQYDIYKETLKLYFIYPLKNICVLSERPIEIHRNERGQLHADGKPAVKYAGGFELYRLNGVKVPKWLVMTPSGKIDAKKALEEKNVDVQREIIRKIGAERVLKAVNAKEIDVYTYPKIGMTYKLYRLKLRGIDRKYLKFEHASMPGVYYCQPVPPETEKAMHGLAWMRRLIEREELENIDEMKEMEIEANLPAVIC